MIVVITGQPGAGKTLHALHMVKEWATREGRTVVYSGIRDLKLPWLEIPDAGDWHKQPANTIVVVDEAQRVFRPRATGSQVPVHVAELETHRHKGIDLVLITQHPKLLDANVRRLVGRHLHVVRNFGMQRATVHEWSELNDACESGSGRKDSIRHEWSYPVELFAAYQSAEVHTHKRRIPARVYFLLVAPILLAGLLYAGYVQFWKAASVGTRGGAVSDGVPGGKADKDARKVLTVGEYLAVRVPRIEAFPHSAPLYDGITAPVRAPYPAVCVASATRCQCYTDQATRIDVPESGCRMFAARGFFVEWDQKPLEVARSGGMGGAAHHESPNPAPVALKPVAQPVAAR